MKRTVFLPNLALVLLLMLTGLMAAAAQSQPDPAIQEAKEEVAVVYDLGRFFGYVHSMTIEESSLVLDAEQKAEFKKLMEKIKGMNRIEPDWAEETLEQLELEVLSAGQLMAVDQRAIEWQNNRETSTSPAGSGAGSGSGSGPMSSYVAGGDFNPIVDESKTIGQGFAALFEYLQ
ncbi:MAG: hypothetical protein U5P10_01590 [Spirochaetia bacterium]|nr:hypothetical protein [Spirochaetia bacterium]